MSEISCPGGERLQSKIAAPERRDSLSLSFAFHEISTSASLNGFKWLQALFRFHEVGDILQQS